MLNMLPNRLFKIQHSPLFYQSLGVVLQAHAASLTHTNVLYVHTHTDTFLSHYLLISLPLFYQVSWLTTHSHLQQQSEE